MHIPEKNVSEITPAAFYSVFIYKKRDELLKMVENQKVICENFKNKKMHLLFLRTSG
jgi:hypothetical protein